MKNYLLAIAAAALSIITYAQVLPTQITIAGKELITMSDFDEIRQMTTFIDHQTGKTYYAKDIEQIEILGTRFIPYKSSDGALNLFRKLNDGTISVLMNETVRNNQLFVSKDGRIHELKVQTYGDLGNVNQIPHFQGILKLLVTDCDSMSSNELEKLKLNTKKIIEFTNRYNENCGERLVYEPTYNRQSTDNILTDFKNARIVLNSGHSFDAPIKGERLIYQGVVQTANFLLDEQRVKFVELNGTPFQLFTIDGTKYALVNVIRGKLSLYKSNSGLNEKLFIQKEDVIKELREIEITQESSKMTLQEYKGVLKYAMNDCHLNQAIEELRLSLEEVVNLINTYNKECGGGIPNSVEIVNGSETKAAKTESTNRDSQKHNWHVKPEIMATIGFGNFEAEKFDTKIRYTGYGGGVVMNIVPPSQKRWYFDWQVSAATNSGSGTAESIILRNYFNTTLDVNIDFHQVILRSYVSFNYKLLINNKHNFELNLGIGGDLLLRESSNTNMFIHTSSSNYEEPWDSYTLSKNRAQTASGISYQLGRLLFSVKHIRFKKIRSIEPSPINDINKGYENQLQIRYRLF